MAIGPGLRIHISIKWKRKISLDGGTLGRQSSCVQALLLFTCHKAATVSIIHPPFIGRTLESPGQIRSEEVKEAMQDLSQQQQTLKDERLR
jgi:hypothetical protein